MFFCWNICLCFFIFFNSPLVSVHQIKQSPLLVLADWFCVGDEPWQSAWFELFVVSQTFVIVIVQTAFFVLGTSQKLGCTKIHQCPKGTAWQSTSASRIIGIQACRQQLGKNVVGPLPGRNWEIGIFASSLCTWPGLQPWGRGVPLVPINNCSGFFCFSPEGLVNTSLTGHQSQAIQGPIPWAAAAKAGTALCRNSFQGDIDKLEYLQAREREREDRGGFPGFQRGSQQSFIQFLWTGEISYSLKNGLIHEPQVLKLKCRRDSIPEPPSESLSQGTWLAQFEECATLDLRS